MPEISFVVATKDRPSELVRMWRSLNGQTRPPREVVIVDAGTAPAPLGEMDQSRIAITYLRAARPSATRQRNRGIAAVRPDAELIGFLDDDVVLEKTAVEEMQRFWTQAGDDVGGAAFNMLNHPPLAWPALKLTSFVEAIGLYSRRRGAVSPAGFQTMISRIETTQWSDWLPSGASVWRRKILDRYRFDEWFQGYSYLEDLDFSYRVGKACRLAVVAPAGYYHFPAGSGRDNGYRFGVREILHRVYFVRKHRELSLGRCYLALSVRLLMNGILAFGETSPYYFERAVGNVIGLAMALGRMVPGPQPDKAAVKA